MTKKISTAIKKLISKTNLASYIANGSREIAPFVSLAIIVASLFSVVFCKMEMRRMGYSVLKLTREERKMRDHSRQQMIQLARITRPERLQAVAQARLTLKRAESGQIIQMTHHGIAFKQ